MLPTLDREFPSTPFFDVLAEAIEGLLERVSLALDEPPPSPLGLACDRSPAPPRAERVASALLATAFTLFAVGICAARRLFDRATIKSTPGSMCRSRQAEDVDL